MLAWLKQNRSKLVFWSGVVVGWGALMASSGLPDGYREAAQVLGWAAFLPSWLQVSPCAGGRCSTGIAAPPGKAETN